MKAIIKIENLIPTLPTVGVYEAVKNDADEILYPIVLNGNYYHLRMRNNNWHAIGLQDDLSNLIGNVINQELLITAIQRI